MPSVWLLCCPLHSEFIHLLASEASEVSEKQQKKVISPEHVVEALHTLGFQEYVEDVQAVHKEYREQASVSQVTRGGGAFVSHVTRGRGHCESYD